MAASILKDLDPKDFEKALKAGVLESTLKARGLEKSIDSGDSEIVIPLDRLVSINLFSDDVDQDLVKPPPDEQMKPKTP